ncbi:MULTISPECIES: 4Fe-4S dicluster domain-containing protein [Bacillota]|uniref:Selenate reductase subunit B n=1 Tax=Mesobacillus selenatarsenatis (strain DSM 18680 / JCM 14380 / FERM P-15431 / SF-1) TaxID=1321606 RepID=SRDB_MESS1|nr:4Fe-4S dicluster domain-containing protein [Mesobacillus selenatarsenatis]BAJ83592.1 putative selenate reductase subunit B [Mesobacillus selenatarsenatis SF-1]GAM13406.1 molybdopterin oxidoreductase iron-sulfur binding subunit [Mesobacillus selenatarsenatis SF-1]
MGSKETKNTSRRDFLIKGAGAAALGAGAFAISQVPLLEKLASANEDTVKDLLPFPELIESDEIIIRMQNDVRRALKKPLNEIQWIMVIDLKKCVGCSSCTVACVSENVLPPGVVYRPVIEEEIGTFPNVTKKFTPRPCMQCEHPPCTKVCPIGATYKSEDGIVAIDYDKCIGCRYCITACPYGARTFDWGEYHTENTPEIMQYEKEPNYEYGVERVREKKNSPIGNARKCHFCKHRLHKGMLSMCVTTCIGRATYIGDKNDPESLVAELIASPRVMRLKEELGTEPNVYYLT